jgi:nickel transport protein
MPRPLLLTLLAAALILRPDPALAHKLNVFAWVEGRKITGEAYFRGHAPLAGGAVSVFGPAGEKIGQTTTDPQGKFHFEPKLRVDHRIVVDAGDGHAETFTVRADELPADLPAGPGSASKAASPPAPTTSPEPSATAMLPDAGGLQSQIGQLRAELQEFKREVRIHDVLGGLGYILGLMGVAFYFLGVRKSGR